MTATIKHEDRLKELLSEIVENLEPEPTTSKFCIYRVPKPIRRINKRAYTPQLISIGPLHHGKEKLADMEKQKRRFVKSIFDQLPVGKDDEIITFIQNNEQNIRDSYAETIKLESFEFVMMILCDAIFIIHFLRTVHPNRSDYSWPYVPAVNSALFLDLQLLENQLPYFVLEGIYNLVFEEGSFMKISVQYFFGEKYPDQLGEVKHFTDLMRADLVFKTTDKEEQKGPIRDLPCAQQLHESGVKFKNTTGEGLDVRFQKMKQHLVPFFRVHELLMRGLTIYDGTECILRNVMAFEQCRYPSDTKVCNYVWLMDSLINNEKDVELLVAEGIISNSVGDNAQVANMFNKLCSCIVLDENSSYHKCCEDLKEHFKNPLNETTATLRRVYFSNLWRGTATSAAAMLLLLTVIQAVCSIMQVV